jgi:hypothetical protein
MIVDRPAKKQPIEKTIPSCRTCMVQDKNTADKTESALPQTTSCKSGKYRKGHLIINFEALMKPY